LNEWLERINVHGALTTLRSIDEHYEKIKALRLKWPATSPSPVRLDRIELVTKDVLARIEAADPRLITVPMLDRLQAPATEILTHLQTFLTDNEGNYKSAHIQSAEGSLDTLLEAAASLPAHPWGDSREVIARSARRFRDMSSAETRRIQGIVASAQQSLTDLSNGIDAAKNDNAQTVETVRSEAATALADAKQEVIAGLKDAQEQGEAGLKASIDQAQTELTSLTTEAAAIQADVTAKTEAFQTELSSIQETIKTEQLRHAEEFGKEQPERKRVFEQQLRSLQEAWQKEVTARDEAADVIKTRLDELKDEAEKILGVRAAAAVYQSWDTEANRQFVQTNVWRVVSLATLFVAGYLGIVHLELLETPSGLSMGNAISHYIPRLGLTGVFLATATFAASQSLHHRSRESQARKNALDLATFRPFLSELKPEDRDRAIEEAARRLFFQDSSLVPLDRPDTERDAG
jgi:hypothetical protein